MPIQQKNSSREYDLSSHNHKFLAGKWCQEWTSSCRIGLKYKKNVDGYTHDVYATIVLMGMCGGLNKTP